MKQLYRPMLKEAWHLSRTHLYLWPLAFFASLIGIAGTFQIFFDIAFTEDGGTGLNNFFFSSDFLTGTFVGWSQAFDQIPWLQLELNDFPLVLAFFALLIIILSFTVVVVSSEGGLIHALDKALDKKKTTYLESFRSGLDNFWSILIVNIAYRLLYLILLGVIVIPLILIVTQTASIKGLLISLLVYFILIPLAITLDLIARYTIIYIVTRNQKILPAISNAWLLFRTNWLISIETALFILAVLLVAFMILSLVILPIIAVLFTLFGALLAFSPLALQLAVIVTLTLLIAVMALSVTVFTVLQMSVWVHIFKKITSAERHHSKIHRLTRHAPWLHRALR